MNEHGKYYDVRRKSFSIERLRGVHMYRGSAGVRYEWVVLFWYAFLYTIPQYREIKGTEGLSSLCHGFSESRTMNR